MMARSTHRIMLWGFFTGCLFASLAATLLAQERAAPSPQTAASVVEEHWNVIYLQNVRAGYSRSRTTTVKRNGRELIRSEEELYLLIKRFGQALQFKVVQAFEETADGRLERFSTTMENPPAMSLRTTGIRQGDKLVVSTEIAGKTRTKEITWERTAKSPAYQQRLLNANPLQLGESRSMRVFVPDTMKFADTEMKAVGHETVKLLDGRKQKLMKVVSTLELAPGQKIPTISYVDEAGETLLSTLSFAGLTLSMYQVERKVALEKLAGAELDLGISTLVKVKAIPRAHHAKKIVYRITISGEDPAEFLVQGTTQTVKKTGEDQVELTVTRAPVPPSAKGDVKRPAAEFTKPSQFLQSDNPLVVERARKAIGEERNPWKKAVLLEKYVQLNLTAKNFSTAMASAAEVAENMEGDCTEHAVLLAAMARAVKIPSRVAAGLVYVDRFSAFGGHMWTELYVNGRWIPLDATLGQGGIGGAHIKLSEASLADDSPTPVASLLPLLTVIAKIKVEILAVEYDDAPNSP